MSDTIYSQTILNEIIVSFLDNKIISKHYFDRYIKFIECRISRNLENFKFLEKHHIIPVSLDESFRTNPNNLILLTPREHFLAHYLLGKAFGGTQWFACNIIVQAENPYQQRKAFVNFNSKLYEVSKTEFRIAIGEIMKESRDSETEEQKLERVEKWRQSSKRCHICDKILRGENHICTEQDNMISIKSLDAPFKIIRDILIDLDIEFVRTAKIGMAFDKNLLNDVMKAYEKCIQEKDGEINLLNRIKQKREDKLDKEKLEKINDRKAKLIEKMLMLENKNKRREELKKEKEAQKRSNEYDKEEKRILKEANKKKQKLMMEKEEKELRIMEKEEKRRLAMIEKEEKRRLKEILKEEKRRLKEILKEKRKEEKESRMIARYGVNYKDLDIVEKRKINHRLKREKILSKFTDEEIEARKLEVYKKQGESLKARLSNMTEEERLARNSKTKESIIKYYSSDDYDPSLKSLQVKNGIKNKKNRNNRASK